MLQWHAIRVVSVRIHVGVDCHDCTAVSEPPSFSATCGVDFIYSRMIRVGTIAQSRPPRSSDPSRISIRPNGRKGTLVYGSMAVYRRP